jgi:hypothetical protein
MKKTMLLATLLTLIAPLLVVAAQPSATSTSLEVLRAAIFTPAAPAPTPTPDAAPAGALWRTSCTVTNDCGQYSPTISCTSASGDCKSGTDMSGPFVKCDGVKTHCAPCHVSTTCGNGTVIACTGTTATDCSVEPRCSITCGSTTLNCPFCV